MPSGYRHLTRHDRCRIQARGKWSFATGHRGRDRPLAVHREPRDTRDRGTGRPRDRSAGGCARLRRRWRGTGRDARSSGTERHPRQGHHTRCPAHGARHRAPDHRTKGRGTCVHRQGQLVENPRHPRPHRPGTGTGTGTGTGIAQRMPTGRTAGPDSRRSCFPISHGVPVMTSPSRPEFHAAAPDRPAAGHPRHRLRTSPTMANTHIPRNALCSAPRGQPNGRVGMLGGGRGDAGQLRPGRLGGETGR